MQTERATGVERHGRSAAKLAAVCPNGFERTGLISDIPMNEADIDRQIASFVDQTRTHLGDFDVLNYAPPIWPHLYLLDVVADGRLVVRVIGQGIRDIVGRPCVGLFVDEFMHGPRSRDVVQTYAACVRDGRAVCMSQCVMLPERPVVTIKACAVPLFHGGVVAKVTGVMHGIATPAQYSLDEAQSRFEAHWMPSMRTELSVTG